MALDQDSYVRNEMAKWKQQQRRAALSPAQRAFEDKLFKWLKIIFLGGTALAIVLAVLAHLATSGQRAAQEAARQAEIAAQEARTAEYNRQRANANPNGPEARAIYKGVAESVHRNDRANDR